MGAGKRGIINCVGTEYPEAAARGRQLRVPTRLMAARGGGADRDAPGRRGSSVYGEHKDLWGIRDDLEKEWRYPGLREGQFCELERPAA